MSNPHFIVRRTAVLLLSLVALQALSPGADDVQAIRKGIRSHDEKVRAETFAKIEGMEGEEREKALSFLEAEHDRWRDEFEDASSRVRGLLKGYEKGFGKKECLREEWEEAARKAMEIIFDTTVFPDPPGPVTGPYTGYDEVMAKVDPARALYKKLRKEADRDLKKISSLSRKKAEKIRDEYLRSRGRAEELGKVLERLGVEQEPLFEPAGVYRALLRLKCGDWKEASPFFLEGEREPCMEEGEEGNQERARATVSPLAGYERTLFFLLYARLADEYNLDVEAPSSRNERAAVAKNNDYRVSLGLCPLQIDARLTKAIRDHLNSVKEMSHYGNTPETETVGDRVRLAGYKVRGGVGENLSQSSLLQSMDGWKWDGGHHRVLVVPGAVHIGVYEKNGCGMDIATGEPPVLPVFDYLEHFGG